jgi:hypothetical protein
MTARQFSIATDSGPAALSVFAQAGAATAAARPAATRMPVKKARKGSVQDSFDMKEVSKVDLLLPATAFVFSLFVFIVILL